MAAVRYFCKNRGRRNAVATTQRNGQFVLNGIDYLEVKDYRTLQVVFIHNLPGQANGVPVGGTALTAANLEITGGVRVRGLRVEFPISATNNILTMRASASGDFSTYTLRLRRSATDAQPPDGFDPQLVEIDFSFKVDCPAEFDCRHVDECPPEILPQPAIDYLSKDYASFRRLMLDRLAVLMPEWREGNPADIGIALVETLAYIADRISYFQDAVATESYLGTARKRVSVRRHARLLDYQMHEGSNARAWICFQFRAKRPGSDASRTLARRTAVLSQGSNASEIVINPSDTQRVNAVLAEDPVVFETMTSVILNMANNRLRFYTWNDAECCLPAGSTRATLLRKTGASLRPGQYLIFQEVLSPTTGAASDADPRHRQVVRLTRADAITDPLNGTDLFDIEWDMMDALAFPVCISAIVRQANGRERLVNNISVARGNVALADHGRTIRGTPQSPNLSPASVSLNAPFRPVLSHGPLTFCAPFDLSQPAAAAVNDPRAARPAITLRGEDLQWNADWYDLLGSNRFQSDFVVEMESDGLGHLRFGDGVHGRKPSVSATFQADFRIGNGRRGMVGAGVLTRIIWDVPNDITGLRLQITNLLPAFGGFDPEPIENVRQFAPQAFRTQRRAVTAADYAAAAETIPDVQKAAAIFRWTGSWYTVFVTIDRRGGLAVDPPFRQRVRQYLELFRLAGYDLEIRTPVFVPLDILLSICVKPGYLRSNVKAALRQLFSNRTLPDGRRGFFHPDNFTFGRPVFLSQVYRAAQETPGVESLEIRRFHRFGRAASNEIENGLISPAPLEILLLANDRSFPENGKIDFEMHGGM